RGEAGRGEAGRGEAGRGEAGRGEAGRGIDSSGDTQPGLATMEVLQMRDAAEARATLLEGELAELRAAVDRDLDEDAAADLGRLRGELAAARDRIAILEHAAAGRADWSPGPG